MKRGIDWVDVSLILLIGASPPTFWGLPMHVRFDTQTGMRAEEWSKRSGKSTKDPSRQPLRPYLFYTPAPILASL